LVSVIDAAWLEVTMFLGLDIGTGSAKAVLLDENGEIVAEAGAAYSVDTPHPRWGEYRCGKGSGHRGEKAGPLVIT
jgi:hypothetical protein